MSGLDRFVYELIDAAQRDLNKIKPLRVGAFCFTRKARDLVVPSKERGTHHRAREQFYTGELEKAEKKLREEGISVEVINPNTGVAYTQTGTICSGSVSMTGGGSQPKFTPKINQDMLGDVERAKAKMLEHRSLAERFEKHARAFACAPDTLVELTTEDADFFKLSSGNG